MSGYQLVHSVDVHVRSKGLVSSYLYNQSSIHPVQVALKPASYFRIVPNLAMDEITIFIGQGGATGHFRCLAKPAETVAWKICVDHRGSTTSHTGLQR